MDVLKRLEAWKNAEKCRSVSIAIDDGYGATCWRVNLHRGESLVNCWETSFICYPGVDPWWHEVDGHLWCCVVPGDDMDDWPGLESTIERAIDCAERFWK